SITTMTSRPREFHPRALPEPCPAGRQIWQIPSLKFQTFANEIRAFHPFSQSTIFESSEVWFSNPLFMNDLQEQGLRGSATARSYFLRGPDLHGNARPTAKGPARTGPHSDEKSVVVSQAPHGNADSDRGYCPTTRRVQYQRHVP